ncbi:MAG: hypothetical protein WBD31_19635 [Rubripirellula sp.]
MRFVPACSVFAAVAASLLSNAGEPAELFHATKLGNPFGVEIRGSQVWVTSVDDQCVYRGMLDSPSLVRVAGNGNLGYSGDGGRATDATMNWPHEVRRDQAGNLFIADTRNHVIRRVDAETSVITTIAGDGVAGFAGEGMSKTNVRFNQPHSVVLDGEGGLLVADTVNHRLRRIDLQTGVVRTIGGNGKKTLPTDGALVVDSPLHGPRSLAVDESSIWIALREGNSVWRIDRSAGTIHHVAGTGKKGYSGDGGLAKDATFSGPKGLAIDGVGRLLVVDTENHVIRRIDLVSGKIETVMGGNDVSASGKLKRPHGINVTGASGFIVADSENNRVLRDE